MHKTAFEVENISTRRNFVLKLDEKENRVYLYDTSRKEDGGCKRDLIEVFHEKYVTGGAFPWNCKTAVEYFEFMYKKSLQFSLSEPVFLGWVDPETFEPLDEEEV